MNHPSALGKLISVCSLIFILGCQQESSQPGLSESDKKEIEQLAADLPLILSNDGWDAYESAFSRGYTNWSMIRENVRTRDEYLDLVKAWYDEGNRATGSEIRTIGFVPISPDMTLYLRSQIERFNDPNDSTVIITRDIRNVGIYKKEDGKWKAFFTAFMDAPPVEGSN